MNQNQKPPNVVKPIKSADFQKFAQMLLEFERRHYQHSQTPLPQPNSEVNLETSDAQAKAKGGVTPVSLASLGFDPNERKPEGVLKMAKMNLSPKTKGKRD